MNKKTIAVLGAGPGLGNHIAEKFCREGFRAVLMARNEERIKNDAQAMCEAGMEADYQAADCADPASIARAFEAVREKYGVVDVLAYNAAVVQPGAASSIPMDEFLRRYQIDVAGAVAAAQQVIPGQAAQGSGAILLTGGGLAFEPNAQYATLSIDKAALRILALALHDELAPKGIYVGIVHVDGIIGGDERHMPARLAEQFYRLYSGRDIVELTY